VKQFDDATSLLNLATHSDGGTCSARRESWLVTALLAFAQLLVGMWWIARTRDAAGPLRLVLGAAYLPPSVWLMGDGWSRYHRR
jgi:hypothetical protein